MPNQIETEAKAAFARRIGVSRQYVGRLVLRGLPVTSAGDVRVAEALAWIRSNVSQQGDNPVENDDEIAPGLVAAKTRLVLANAARAEHALERERGASIDLDDAKRAVRSLMRIHRDAMLNFANRYGPAIAAEIGVKPAELVTLLDARIRDALIEVANTKLPFTMTNAEVAGHGDAAS